LFCLTALFLQTHASAQETTTFEYDARGRLVESATSGGPNNDVEVSVEYDAAGNRISYEDTAPNPIPEDYLLIPVSGGKMVVVIY
jgi:YD repeat-containing protein